MKAKKQTEYHNCAAKCDRCMVLRAAELTIEVHKNVMQREYKKEFTVPAGGKVSTSLSVEINLN